MNQPRVRVTRFTVTTDPEPTSYGVDVEERAPGRWAVIRMGYHLSVAGTWDWTPRQFREDWQDAHQFDLATALKLADDFVASEAARRAQLEADDG